MLNNNNINKKNNISHNYMHNKLFSVNGLILREVALFVTSMGFIL